MNFRRALHAASLVFVFTLLDLPAVAQQAGGVITGRVITEDGLPIPHAMVNVFGVSGRVKQTSVRRETVADDDGKFVADGLDAIPYLVSAWVPGYVPASDGGVLNPFELNEARFVRVGESVTVKLIRGGVITGRVTNDAGEPVIGAPVRATRVRDETGLSTSADVDYAHLWTRTTDDRGVYRIYGLAPGAYIVAAGGSDASSARSTPFAGRTITYHPSSTRDAATLVNVSSGSEATSIDVVYRGDSGFAISGKIRGAPGTTSAITQTSTKIFLRSRTRNETIDTTTSQSNNNQNGYAFYGVPNGEYEVIARNDGMDGGNGLDSTASRVTVKGADVTGIDLTLVPNATVSGVVVVMKMDSHALECQNHRKSYPEEIIVRARSADPADKRRRLLPVTSGYGVGIPNDEGVFTIRDLKPGRHRIELELPDKTWYLKAMAMTGSKPAVDPRTGLTVKSGDKLSGLRLTIASGAALLKGKIMLAENTKLPARLHVHLIPAEAEAKDDVLRFAETSADADGAFTFTNLAPGKYFALARAIPGSESGDKLLRSGAWEAAERKKLRKEAEAENDAIELKPCQPITGYALRLTK
jgi:protocatechuate 3,4-dioxygenase beta subunit